MTASVLGFKIQRVKEQLRAARADRATDAQMKSGQRTFVMVDKKYRIIDEISREELQFSHEQWLTEEQRAVIAGGRTVTIVITDEQVGGRVRLTAGRDDNGPYADFRFLPAEPPKLEVLQLPPEVRDLYKLRFRLVLLAAPPNNAKSTIAHAYINEINRSEMRHIATGESPVEIVHTSIRSTISPHTIGDSIYDELELAKSIRRRNIGVTYVGELIDLLSMRAALRAASNGLVIATVHSLDAPGAVEGFIEMFDPSERDQIRVLLANHLGAVVACRLLPKAREPGMVIATELLVNTEGVRAHILRNDFGGLVGDMQMGGQTGMHVLEKRLAYFVAKGIVSEADARLEVTRPSVFEAELTREKRAS